MKITVLSENTTVDARLQSEFGLSVYVEKGDTRLLFDLGTAGAAIDNAAKLGIDLSACTAIAFSHNHRDHCGGFLRFAKEFRPACPVYVHHGFFTDKWWDHRRDDPSLPTHEQALELVGPAMSSDFFFANGCGGFRALDDAVTEIGKDVFLVGSFPIQHGWERVHISQLMDGRDGRLTRDTFRDEQVCVIRTKKGIVILTGCAHNGICNILKTVQRRFPGENVLAVIGGTHLLPPQEKRIKKTVEYFRTLAPQCAGVCHCTGPVGLSAFEEGLPSYRKVGSGFVFETED